MGKSFIKFHGSSHQPDNINHWLSLLTIINYYEPVLTTINHWFFYDWFFKPAWNAKWLGPQLWLCRSLALCSVDSWDGLERLDLGHCEVLPVQGAPKEKSFFWGGESWQNPGKLWRIHYEWRFAGKNHRENGFPACNVWFSEGRQKLKNHCDQGPSRMIWAESMTQARSW